jgi:hypothetical protein
MLKNIIFKFIKVIFFYKLQRDLGPPEREYKAKWSRSSIISIFGAKMLNLLKFLGNMTFGVIFKKI